MNNDVDNRPKQESNAQKVVKTLLENETVPPKPPAQCAWCKRWYDHTGNFIPEPPHDPARISHGICKPCMNNMMGGQPQQPVSAG